MPTFGSSGERRSEVIWQKQHSPLAPRRFAEGSPRAGFRQYVPSSHHQKAPIRVPVFSFRTRMAAGRENFR